MRGPPRGRAAKRVWIPLWLPRLPRLSLHTTHTLSSHGKTLEVHESRLMQITTHFFVISVFTSFVNNQMRCRGEELSWRHLLLYGPLYILSAPATVLGLALRLHLGQLHYLPNHIIDLLHLLHHRHLPHLQHLPGRFAGMVGTSGGRLTRRRPGCSRCLST